jgi:hypothetical protein
MKKTVYDAWSSHFYVLAAISSYAQSINSGCFRILELGSGYYSTPMFHMMMTPMQSKELVTCESDGKWLKRFIDFENSWHKLVRIEDWSKCSYLDQEWDVVFVDHAPSKRRHIDLLRIYESNKARFIVCHDTEKEWEKRYKWNPVFKKFKYKKKFKFLTPNTTVLSNFEDIPF